MILLSVVIMNHDAIYTEMLSILEEHYEKNPPYFVPSSELRARLHLPVDELRPYAEALEKEGYAQKLEGLAPTFIVKFTPLGHKAFKNHVL